jgi:hypothetical protein
VLLSPGAPSILLWASIFYLFQKYSSWKFCPVGVVQYRYPDDAVSGPEFQLPEFPLLVHTLQIMREKALELLQKGLLFIKTL